MSDEPKHDMLSKLKQRVFALPPKTPEEIAQRNADLQARNGTSIEWAELQPDLSIAQNISQYMMDGTHGHGHSESIPGNDDYEELLKLHKLEKPGDASTIFRRFIDGAWVVVDTLD